MTAKKTKKTSAKKPATSAASISAAPAPDNADLIRAVIAAVEQGQREHREIATASQATIAELLARVDGLAAELKSLSRPKEPTEPKGQSETTAILQQMVAGACKTLPAHVHTPTPAIIGRAMSDLNALAANLAVQITPGEVFKKIEDNGAFHLGASISKWLKQLFDGGTSKTSAESSKQLDRYFRDRFLLIENMRLGQTSDVRKGKKLTYRRVLNERGGRVFYRWPDWADSSGGIDLAEEPPTIEPAPSEGPGLSLTEPGDETPGSDNRPPTSPPA